MIRWLKERRIGGVVTFGYSELDQMRIIQWCAKNCVPCLMWGDSNIHGDRVKGLAAFAKRLIVSRVVSRCSAILACGRFGKAYFGKYGARDERIFIVPNEPDYDGIRLISSALIEQVRTTYGLRLGRRRLVFSGRLTSVKRVDLLIDAFCSIADQRPQWDLVIVGDGDLREAMQDRVSARLRERVCWTGFIDRQVTVSAIYRCSDVLVLPSSFEPWALVVNEAAAAGLALVCSSVVGAAAELVRDGVNGRIFPSGDLDGLIACLLDVTDPDHVDMMKAASGDALDDWRRRADPVAGLRQALRYCGLIA